MPESQKRRFGVGWAPEMVLFQEVLFFHQEMIIYTM